MQTFIFIKPLTMKLCTLCKIVSMSKQYSGTVGLRTKINLATRYYIIKGSFKGQANRKPSGIFSGTSAASLIYHFLQENLNFEVVGWWRFVFPWFAAQTLHIGRSVEKMTGNKIWCSCLFVWSRVRPIQIGLILSILEEWRVFTG